MPFDQKAYMKKYREENKERLQALHKVWTEKNKDKMDAYRKTYDENNKEKVSVRKKAWAAANRERSNAQKKAWAKRNPEYKKAYSKANKEKIAASKAVWRENNKDKINVTVANRRALKFRATIRLTELDKFVIEEMYNLAQLREKQTGFQWHVDHIVPLTKGGLHKPTNLQVVPGVWNLSKGNRSEDKWT
jgi:hypothetical protein